MGKIRKYLVTIFHDSTENNSALHVILKKLGYKRSFVKDNESHDLPDNMFIRKVDGEDSEIIRKTEILAVEKLLNDQKIEHGKIGVFVGEDWTSVVAVDD